MDLLAKFFAQVAPYQPQRVLVGLSGGVDSVVLLHLWRNYAQQYPCKVRAIHIHHGISHNADMWLKFCEDLCQQWQIEFHGEKVVLPASGNLEHNARNARYGAVAHQILPTEIFTTAHHRDDQVETFFLAIKRGSGLKGLSAMAEFSTWHHDKSSMLILRPLLNFSREEIVAYAKEHHLSWINDESNQDPSYDRNFLRLCVLPALRERWDNFDGNIARTAEICGEQQQLIEGFLRSENPQLQKVKPHLDLMMPDNFYHLPLVKQNAILRLWLGDNGINPSYKQLEQIRQDVIEARLDANPAFQLGDKILRRYRHILYLTPNFTDVSDFNAPLKVGETMQLPDNLGELTVEKQENFLRIRREWQENSSAMEAEMLVPAKWETHSIKVRFKYHGKVRLANGIQETMKKCWQKSEVPPWQRSRIPLIFADETFLGAVGFFINHLP